MRARSKLLAVISAAVLITVQAFSASAAPPRVTYLDCPDVSAIGVIVGKEPVASPGMITDCFYFTPEVSFRLTDATLAGARADTEQRGYSVVDAPGAGEGAFYYAFDGGTALYFERDGQVIEIASPTLTAEIIVNLADLAGDAISLSPELTPAANFTVKCPTGTQVSKALGAELKREKVEARSCRYSNDQEWLDFEVLDVGSAAELRAHLELLWRGMLTGVIADFDGLGPGAFMYADASPLHVVWQHSKGVVFQTRGWSASEELRRVAVLFNTVQTGGSPPGETPSKPGVPSTGV